MFLPLSTQFGYLDETNSELKDNNQIAIDLVGAELLSKLPLNLRGTLLAEFGVLLRTVLQVLLLLVIELSHKLSGVSSPELEIKPPFHKPTSPEGICCPFCTTDPAPTIE